MGLIALTIGERHERFNEIPSVSLADLPEDLARERVFGSDLGFG
jgi:hypothetical protein